MVAFWVLVGEVVGERKMVVWVHSKRSLCWTEMHTRAQLKYNYENVCNNRVFILDGESESDPR